MMVDKEFSRLKRKDLLQMLIMQCEETERLQQEVDQTSARLRELEASYERLKVKLDVKDDRLNQKDAKIAELRRIVQKLKTAEKESIRPSVHAGERRKTLKYKWGQDAWRNLIRG